LQDGTLATPAIVALVIEHMAMQVMADLRKQWAALRIDACTNGVWNPS
jgi:hypothetical protein